MKNIINGENLRPSEEKQPVSGSCPSPRVDECRRLVARRYIEEGYVSERDIDPETGFISEAIDPYVGRSDYFWELNEDGKVAATLRIIRYSSEDGNGIFPIETDFSLYPAYQDFIGAVKRLSPESIIEVSALAKEKDVDRTATYELYRSMWQHAKRSDYAVCLIAADQRLDKKLTDLFGDALHRIGEPEYYLGSWTVPSILLPDDCARAMSEIYWRIHDEEGEEAAESYRYIIDYLRQGLEPHYFGDEEKRYLSEIGINVE